MTVLSKKEFDKIIEEVSTIGTALIDRKVLLECIENYTSMYIPNNFKTTKREVCAIIKHEEDYKIILLPLNQWNIDGLDDERINAMDVILTDDNKIIETDDNSEIIQRKGW